MGIPWLMSMATALGISLVGHLQNCIGISHLPFHGILLWVGHWAFAHLHSMELLLVLLNVSSMESVLWVAHWDVPPWASHGIALGVLNGDSMVVANGYCIGHFPFGPSMELHWDLSLVIPWHSSMGRALGICPSAFYGIALVLLIVTSMESVLWVAHWDGHPPWASHGIALGVLNGDSMVVVYGYCIGISPYGPSMELHWDFPLAIPWHSSMGRALCICPSAF